MPYPQDFSMLNNWVGSMPNYSGGYQQMLGAQSAPLSLGRMISMVNDLQNSYARNMSGANLGNPTVSPMVTTAQMPQQIANAIMSQQNRLLSLPRSRMATDPYVNPDITTPDPNVPADTGGGYAPQPTYAPQASGGGGGGNNNFANNNVNYTPTPGFGNYSVPSSPASTPTYKYTPPTSAPKYWGNEKAQGW